MEGVSEVAGRLGRVEAAAIDCSTFSSRLKRQVEGEEDGGSRWTDRPVR